jgi:hypothetical protein
MKTAVRQLSIRQNIKIDRRLPLSVDTALQESDTDQVGKPIPE